MLTADAMFGMRSLVAGAEAVGTRQEQPNAVFELERWKMYSFQKWFRKCAVTPLCKK